MTKNNKVYLLVLTAMFLALTFILPFFTGQIPTVGKALSPMHIPVLLCGFFCGPWFAMGLGFVAPLLRSLLFGMPPMVPVAIPMAFELACYGFLAGLLYQMLPKRNLYIYVALIVAMLGGRIVWGLVKFAMAGLVNVPFSFDMFLAGGFINAVPGIILHIVLIPILVMALKKYTYKYQA